MNRTLLLLALAGLALLAAVFPALAQLQPTGVTAEAVGQANLRAAPGTEFDLLGQITAGTRYPVLARSEFFPWYLLGDPVSGQPFGWVFAELVTVYGDPAAVPISTLELGTGGAAPPTPTPPPNASPVADATATLAAATPTATLAASVVGNVLGEINVRYGPGTEYARVGIAREGDQLHIVRWHAQLPWVEIAYPDAPGGVAWVASDLLQIQGELSSLPSTSQTFFNLPTLTPTPSVVRPVGLLDATPVPLRPAFQALGDQVWRLMVDAGFENGTSRPGALFLMDLQTGEAVAFGDDIAFSGMSLNKIGILATLYSRLGRPLDSAQANTVAEAMICSENISTNRVLSEIGSGDPFQGAEDVTALLTGLGLRRTFLTAPFGNDPFLTPQWAPVPDTDADQASAEPDPYNQMTVSEMGTLLAGIYQCAYQETGPLLAAFPQSFTPTECRQMLHAMSNNKINALFESGVPLDTRIAHKHGWIDDTHGDAAVIFTPGGNYVMVAVVHNPTWLDYSESFPLLAEMSRAVYNFYNPDAPVAEIRPGDGAEQCELLGNPLIEDLQAAVFEQ